VCDGGWEQRAGEKNEQGVTVLGNKVLE